MTSRKKGGIRGTLLAAGAALIALAAPSAADAYEAYVTTPAPLMSGPAPDYPPVLNFNGGEPVTVYGCLQDYAWCDVSFQNYRGWFEGDLLSFAYEGRQAPIFDFGYAVGIPVIGFSFDDYWGRYYYDRPFFRERERWARIAPPPPRPHAEGWRGPGIGIGIGGRPGFDRRDDHGPEGRPAENRPGGEHGPGVDIRPEAQRAPQGQRPPEGQRPAEGQRPPQAQQPRPQAQQPHPQGQQPRPPAAAQPKPPAPQPPHPAEKPHEEGEHREEAPH